MFKYRKLRGRMAELGMSQQALADTIGTSIQALNSKLNGHHDFKLHDIKSICAVLKIAPADVAIFFDMLA